MGLTQGALDHAHFGVEVVDHGNKDGFRRRRVNRRPPLRFALVTEDDVLEALEALGIEFGFQAGLAHQLVAEDHVTLENAAPTAFRGQRAFVLNGFAGVVEEYPRHRQIGVDFGVNREQRAAGSRHVLLCDPDQTLAQPLLAQALLDPSPGLAAFWRRANFNSMTVRELIAE